MKILRAAAALVLFTAAAAAQSQVIFEEGFDNVAGLAGWAQADSSSPTVVPWFQGNPGIFASQAGAPSAYIAGNVVTTAGGFADSVSHYLITPVFSLATATELSFWMRSNGLAEGFPDRLQVLLSTAGNSTSIGSFTSVLFDSDNVGGDWTFESLAIAAAGGTGRIAFRHFIPDALLAGSYLGIDTVRVVAAVPEPSVVLSMTLGLGALGWAASRRRRQSSRAARA